MAAELDPSNRFGWDYRREAARFRALPRPVIDVHLHLNGAAAAEIFRQAAEPYGVGVYCSMTRFEEMPSLRSVLGEAVNFIAMPNYRGEDPLFETGAGFIEKLDGFRRQGARIVKFWSAPRRIELARAAGLSDFLRIDSPQILQVMHAARERGMIFMTHIGDPDIWFATKYADSSVYGTKWSQYEPLEELLRRFENPWIAAHLGGAPEHLDFLSRLLERHPNLYLDTGAAKWMVRELSRHSVKERLDFFGRWQGRILFGSDIVTSDQHLRPTAADGTIASSIAGKAASPAEAFNLYASRYWAYRALFETDYNGESPIADPDLTMVAPEKYRESDAPRLKGAPLPEDVLYALYWGAARELLKI